MGLSFRWEPVDDERVFLRMFALSLADALAVDVRDLDGFTLWPYHASTLRALLQQITDEEKRADVNRMIHALTAGPIRIAVEP
jgi:hypothetical protein